VNSNEDNYVWFVPILILLIATLKIPYGFYFFIRLVVCLTAAYISFLEYNIKHKINVWVVFFASIAILFNPIIKIYLLREQWFYLDILCASVFLIHYIYQKNFAK
jgi:hypothetical protein